MGAAGSHNVAQNKTDRKINPGPTLGCVCLYFANYGSGAGDCHVLGHAQDIWNENVDYKFARTVNWTFSCKYPPTSEFLVCCELLLQKSSWDCKNHCLLPIVMQWMITFLCPYLQGFLKYNIMVILPFPFTPPIEWPALLHGDAQKHRLILIRMC